MPEITTTPSPSPRPRPGPCECTDGDRNPPRDNCPHCRGAYAGFEPQNARARATIEDRPHDDGGTPPMNKTAHKTVKAHAASYRAAAARLLAALTAHNSARAAYDLARDALEDRRRALLLDGVPGLPERPSPDQREAALGRALDPEARVMRAARERLRSAETELEAAKVEERAERELLRVVTLQPAE